VRHLELRQPGMDGPGLDFCDNGLPWILIDTQCSDVLKEPIRRFAALRMAFNIPAPKDNQGVLDMGGEIKNRYDFK